MVLSQSSLLPDMEMSEEQAYVLFTDKIRLKLELWVGDAYLVHHERQLPHRLSIMRLCSTYPPVNCFLEEWSPAIDEHLQNSRYCSIFVILYEESYGKHYGIAIAVKFRTDRERLPYDVVSTDRNIEN